MSETVITKKRSILKTLCKESTLFHVIAGIILAAVAIFLDYWIAAWEVKTFGLVDGPNDNYICNIVLRMFLNAVITFVAVFIIGTLFNLLRSGISQMIALIRYCYLPLTESEVRGKFTTEESYIRYMENKLQYKRYYSDVTYTHYKTVTEDDIRKILQVCHKVFGSGSIFFGICNNRRKSNEAGYDWFRDNVVCVLEGMGFLYKYNDKTRQFVNFMSRYMEFKDNGQPFKEATVVNEDGTVTLSYSYKYGNKMNKVDTKSFTF